MKAPCSDLLKNYLEKNNTPSKDNTGVLKPFAPYPAAKDRLAYGQLSKEGREKAIQAGEPFLHFSYPSIHATDYMKFKRNGNRKDFEDICFSRRRALNSLVTAECAEGQGRFLDDIVNGIYMLCEESGWQLPAHNSYIRDMPQMILPDTKRPVVDLFAAETGAQLAMLAYLLKDALDEISPLIVKRIMDELEQRIIVPYLTEHFWWIGLDGGLLNNWTPWCTQNVLLTALLGDFCEDTKIRVLERACASLDTFLDAYGEDGCCDEGAQYYHHAGGCLFHALDIMDQVTDGAFHSLFSMSKIKNIAAYILNVHIDDKYYFNFADCSPVAGRAGAGEYLFGKRTGQEPLMHFSAKDYVKGGCSLYPDEGLNLYYRIQTLFTRDEMIKLAETTQNDRPSAQRSSSGTEYGKQVFYESAGLFIASNVDFALAAKAGHNADSHNHNDVGSFILYKNGKPLFADIGVETYSQKTFSDRRYEIWTMQSGYHNLPVINGLEQKDGAEYSASKVQASFTEKESSFSMNIAGAYPIKTQERASEPLFYTRKLSLDREHSRVLLSDSTNAGNVELHFITYEKPVLSDKEILFENFAGVTYQGAVPVKVETLPITDARLQTAWDHDLYRIILKMTGTDFSMEIK